MVVPVIVIRARKAKVVSQFFDLISTIYDPVINFFSGLFKGFELILIALDLPYRLSTVVHPVLGSMILMATAIWAVRFILLR